MPKTLINGVQIHYELMGEGETTLVFLNGIAMSIAHWKPMIEAMGSGYRCLCHDMRGQTLSGKPDEAYSMKGHADDLAALMDSLGIGRAHIIGTSYGSEVGMAFAFLYPEKCQSLSVIDGVSELDPVLIAAADSWIATAKLDPIAFYRTLLPWTYSSKYIKECGDVLAAREKSMLSLPKEWFTGFVRLCEAFKQIDMTADLHRIVCPTLVLVGSKDILKPRRFSKIIADNIPGAVLRTVPEAGHASVIERPAVVARMETGFISQHA
ncbi:MAG: alpha/beta hydrolase [Spirochaetaceae bacterium]|nr:alpha/beta hydrolase [Spirochaetaceae bacterium]